MRIRLALVYCVAALSTAALVQHGRAAALTNQRYPAAFCQVDSDLSFGEYDAAYTSPFDSSGLSNGSSTDTAYWHCPLLDVIPGTDDDDGLDHSEITTVNIHGDDTSGSIDISARVCYQNYDSNGGDCDTVDTSPEGVFTLSLTGTEIDIWGSNVLDFAYLQISMPSNNNSSRVWGYWVQG